MLLYVHVHVHVHVGGWIILTFAFGTVLDGHCIAWYCFGMGILYTHTVYRAMFLLSVFYSLAITLWMWMSVRNTNAGCGMAECYG
jgi:hypothetical protein